MEDGSQPDDRGRSDAPPLEPTASVLGMLQRGLGRGFVEAQELDRSELTKLLLECVVHDPRIFPATEERAHYYGSLAADAGLEPILLAPSKLPELNADTGGNTLVIDVLLELIEAQVPAARETLLTHIDQGPDWVWACERLAKRYPEVTASLPSRLSKRLTDDEVEHHAADLVRIFPLARWPRSSSRAQEAVASAAREKMGLEREIQSQLRSNPRLNLPAVELLDSGWSGPTNRVVQRLSKGLRPGEEGDVVRAAQEQGPGRVLAFAALTETANPSAVEGAEKVLVSSDSSATERNLVIEYLKSLDSTICVPLARGWLQSSGNRRLELAAIDVFSCHGSEADLPDLVREFAAAVDSNDFERMTPTLVALRRFPQEGPFDGLERSFEEIDSSYIRSDLAKTMMATDAETFITRFARSSLWDCEPFTQRIAADHVVEADPEVKEQLEAISSADSIDR